MYSHSVHSVLQNKTIEERVTILEAQMTEIQPDIVEVKDEVAFLFDEVAVLDDGQALQDDRTFNLEEETSGLVSLYYQAYLLTVLFYHFQLYNHPGP